MIAKLKGQLESASDGTAVIDVGGVGYLVQVSSRTLARFGPAGTPVTLHIKTIVREDQFSLFGFLDLQEKTWFEILTTVQGVGAKAALAILAVLGPDQISLAIAAQDKAAFTQADGVGPKLATRLLTELKDKVDDTMLGKVASLSAAKAQQTGGSLSSSGVNGDAVSALVNLGYGRAEAFGAVSSVAQNMGDEMDIETLIQKSLKELCA